MFWLVGCTLMRDPTADIHKLGTVVKLGHSITIKGIGGIVTVEYVDPTKRRIIFDGEAREIRLFKSSLLNGLYREHTGLHPSIEGIKDVDYVESTSVYKSQADVDAMVDMFTEHYGYEHRPSEQILVYLEVRKYINFGIKFWNPKYMIIKIQKYAIDEKNGRSFLVDPVI